MRIGISVLSRAGQSIWQNGLGQNVVFLAQLFRRLTFVESVVLIDVGSEGALPPEVDAVSGGLRVVSQSDATDLVDIVFEAAGQLDIKWLDLMRSRGHKVVYYCCGQPYVGLVEPAVFERPVFVSRPDRCDEVWLFGKDRSLIPMMRTLHRCEVYEVPFIWHPAFLETRAAQAAQHGVQYGYKPDRANGAGFRVAIFEPNISVVKCCSIPMLACDEAWRENPQSVRDMHVLNTLHMKDHATMLYLANSLDLVRNHRARFHGRHDVVGFLGQHGDAVVAHQWQNEQNYAYLDALYGDYPLVHNSRWLGEAGYYYPGFDAAAAGGQLLRAFREHDAELETYRRRSQAVFDAVNPFAQHNLDAYAERLLALEGRTANTWRATVSMIQGGPRNLKVGVSLHVRKGGQSLWENGIFQNCLFLVMLLRELPSIGEVYIVMGGDGSEEDARRLVADVPVPVMTQQEAIGQLDLMIEMSAQLGRDWIVEFRQRGGRIVSMRVGNDYVIDIERMIFDRPNALLISGAPYHEIWTLPQYEHICAPYYRSAMRVPVRIVPHIWSPLVLERAIERDPQAREQFGYRAGRRRWRAGIFEPNICMVKTSPIPMLCCEVAHRLDPEMLEQVWVYSTLRQKEHAGFSRFASSLDIVRHGLATFEGRFPFHQMMGRCVDAVVAHQWENAQNYLYYEALYGGYPLVHNSHLIGACGYRYDAFDCEQGGRALLRAYAEHDANQIGYRETAQAFLRTLAPDYAPNVKAYGDAIEALFTSEVSA